MLYSVYSFFSFCDCEFGIVFDIARCHFHFCIFLLYLFLGGSGRAFWLVVLGIKKYVYLLTAAGCCVYMCTRWNLIAEQISRRALAVPSADPAQQGAAAKQNAGGPHVREKADRRERAHGLGQPCGSVRGRLQGIPHHGKAPGCPLSRGMGLSIESVRVDGWRRVCGRTPLGGVARETTG